MRHRDPLADPEPLIRRVYAYVAYRIGDGPDAEDATAEVFERAVRYRDSYDSKLGDPAGWLVGIARRVLVSRASERTAPLDDVPDVTDDLEESIVRRITIASAVARLGARDRELVALRFGADLSAREIGVVLEMTTNAVEVALHRAIGRLRDDLTSGSGAQAASVARPVAPASD